MLTVRLASKFESWLGDLRDKKAQVRIAARLRQADAGNLGRLQASRGRCIRDAGEFRARLSAVFHRRGSVLIVVLAGGDTSSQAADIRRAQRILKQLESEL